MKHGFILSSRCDSKESLSQDRKAIISLVQFNIAEVCPRCSGGVACGATYNVFHPITGTTAALRAVLKADEPKI